MKEMTLKSIADEGLLVRELNHRISNEYTALMNMLTLASFRTSNAEARLALVAAAERVDGYARVHRAFRVPEQGDHVDATVHLRELCCCMSYSRLAQNGIDLVFDEQPLTLCAEQCWYLKMIVYELVNNAAQHAFNNAGGEIRVAVVRASEYVECQVMDDGMVRPGARRGRGLGIVNKLTLRLGGRFDQSFTSRGSISRVVFRARQA